MLRIESEVDRLRLPDPKEVLRYNGVVEMAGDPMGDWGSRPRRTCRSSWGVRQASRGGMRGPGPVSVADQVGQLLVQAGEDADLGLVDGGHTQAQCQMQDPGCPH